MYAYCIARTIEPRIMEPQCIRTTFFSSSHRRTLCASPPTHPQVPEAEVEAASRGQFRGAGVVLHAYDEGSKLGASLDLLLEAKAGSYMGTRYPECGRITQ